MSDKQKFTFEVDAKFKEDVESFLLFLKDADERGLTEALDIGNSSDEFSDKEIEDYLFPSSSLEDELEEEEMVPFIVALPSFIFEDVERYAKRAGVETSHLIMSQLELGYTISKYTNKDTEIVMYNPSGSPEKELGVEIFPDLRHGKGDEEGITYPNAKMPPSLKVVDNEEESTSKQIKKEVKKPSLRIVKEDSKQGD